MITVERIDEMIEDVKAAYYEQIERDYAAWERYRDERPQMNQTLPMLVDLRFKDLHKVERALADLRHAMEISCEEE